MLSQRFKSTTYLVALVPLAISCAAGAKSSTKAMIGDSRFSPESDAILREEVGVLTVWNGVCTAFVSGPNQITTAAHCLNGTQAKDLTTFSFKTASGTTSSLTAIIREDPKKDYLTLATSLTFKNTLPLGTLQNGQLKLVGFDTQKNNLLTDSCAFEKRTPGAGVFTYSCSTIPGMSGAPLLQNGQVVGLHLGYQPDLKKNAAFEVSLLDDPSADVTLVGIEDECGWGCGGDWNVHIHPRNPIDGGTIGGVVGGLLGGGIVIGAGVGALIGDHNLAQQKIAELRAQNADQAADLLQLKVDLSSEETQHRADKESESAANNCLKSNGTAYNYVLTHIDAAHQTFLSCLDNAADNAASNACLSTYDSDVQMQMLVGRSIGGC